MEYVWEGGFPFPLPNDDDGGVDCEKNGGDCSRCCCDDDSNYSLPGTDVACSRPVCGGDAAGVVCSCGDSGGHFQHCCGGHWPGACNIHSDDPSGDERVPSEHWAYCVRCGANATDAASRPDGYGGAGRDPWTPPSSWVEYALQTGPFWVLSLFNPLIYGR